MGGLCQVGIGLGRSCMPPLVDPDYCMTLAEPEPEPEVVVAAAAAPAPPEAALQDG